MQRNRRVVQQALSRKGFRMNNTHHSSYCFYTAEGKKTPVRTRISHGSNHRSLGAELLANMARQCKLTKSEFLDLIDCPLSREQYETRLAQDGKL